MKVSTINDKPTGSIQTASRQLFSREDDEMAQTPEAFLANLKAREENTVEIPIHQMFVESYDDGTGLKFIVNNEDELSLNDRSFGQVCQLAHAPKQYINSLPPELASRNLNYGLTQRQGNGIVANTAYDVTRAIYSSKYERMSDYKVAQEILDIALPMGYRPAGEFAGKRGGMAPVNENATGLYHGQDDMFMFLANENTAFNFDGEDFFHTVIMWNSETTVRQIGGLTSLYRFICGNHQIWGSRDTIQLQARHIGNGPRDVLEAMKTVLVGYDKYRQQIEEQFKLEQLAARLKPFADTRDKVQEKLSNYLNRKRAVEVLPFIEEDERAYLKNPYSLYGVAQGVTLYAQTFNNANERNEIELVAGDIVTKGIKN